MHIAILCDSGLTGTADARLVGLLQALQRAGHTASLVLGAGAASQEASHLLTHPVCVVPVQADMSAGAAVVAADALSQFCEEHQVDVLHTFAGVSLLIGALAAARLKRPYVVALDEPLDVAAGNISARWLLLEHVLSGAKRVFCSRSDVARTVLLSSPAAECRPFPPATLARPSGPLEAWEGYLNESLKRDARPMNLDAPQRLRRLLEQNADVSIGSNDMERLLLRALDAELLTIRGRLAQLIQARAFESDRHEQALNRTRQRLETTEQRLNQTMIELASARAGVERLTVEVAHWSERAVVSERLLSQRDQELAEIKGSTGWALLLWLWKVRVMAVPHGSLRDRALWIALSTVRALRQGNSGALVSAGVRALSRNNALSRLLDRAPLPIRTWVDSRLTAVGPAHLVPSTTDGTLFGTWSDNPVLTVPAHPQPTKYDVIFFPIIDWAFRFQRPQQLASQFADAGHRVFYLATTFGQEAELKPLRHGVAEVRLPGPTGMSLYQDDLAPLVNHLTQAMAQVRGQFNIADAVCIVHLPFWAPLVLQLRSLFGWKIIYDCLDDYGGFSNTSRRMLRAEQSLTSESNLVTVTSRGLLNKQSALNPTCELIPNASDFQHFRFSSFAPPDELRGLREGRPIVGYYGAIADWFDSSLVASLARARPNWEFVLIGSTVGSDLRPLQNQPNIHLLGEKPYNDLPPYLHAFHVGIIPFKKLPLTEATNPVKLFEYATAGKPIVATDLAELRHYREYAKLASDVPSWLEALDSAVAPPDPAGTLRRVDFARRNSWSQRLAQFEGLIAPLYPLATIIIVTYNNSDYTRLCLESIFAKTAYPTYEVIVVDNGSTDDTTEFLQQFALSHANVRVILNETNYGFAKANNIGMGSAKGEYVVFLNNDTVVTPNWLSRLIYYLGDQRVGMVGPVTNWSGNESRIEVPYTTISGMERFAEAYTRDKVGVTFEIDMLALFCVAMRRSVVEEVGLLDERFGIGMFEDDDFALRVRERGYILLCAEDIFVHHWGRASFSRLQTDQYHRLFADNRRQFESKWGRAWEPHRSRAERGSLALQDRPPLGC